MRAAVARRRVPDEPAPAYLSRRPTLKTIEADELKARIDRGDHFRLVETLPEESYRSRHLPGAVHLPPEAVRENAEDVLPEVEESIVVYGSDAGCPSCADALETLESLGYENVTWFRRGKEGWERAGYAMEGDDADG